MNPAHVPLGKYILSFSLVYAALVIIIDMMLNVFGVKMGVSPYFIVLIAAAWFAGARFVNEHKRAFSADERNRLIISCLAASVVISILDMLLVIFITTGSVGVSAMMAELKTIPVSLWLGIIVFALALYYLLLSLVFRWGIVKYAEKQKA